jgi:hypothetical protein
MIGGLDPHPTLSLQKKVIQFSCFKKLSNTW